MAPIREAVYATLLLNDAYLPGAMVLAHSLRDSGASARLVVLATVKNITQAAISVLNTVYNEIIPVETISNVKPANLYRMDRPDLISAFTKIELWRQTQFRTIVYLDADVVAIRAPNELLNSDAHLSAVPDVGWPDCFNSGMLVLQPNMGDYYSLLALAERGISFDGADQGLLNMHFRRWHRLSFTYNCTPSGSYQYVPAYKHFHSSISLVHFIGREKPWKMGRNAEGSSEVFEELLGRWWAVYNRYYHCRSGARNLPDTARKIQELVQGERLGVDPTSLPPSSARRQHKLSQTSLPPSVGHEKSLETRPEQRREATHDGAFSQASLPHLQSTSTAQMQWDAAHAPPPLNSEPEAHSLPTKVYKFNNDTSLFHPPRYPDAPKNMHYDMPQRLSPSETPKAVFPWESYAPKPTRIFPTEHAASPFSPQAPPQASIPHSAVLNTGPAKSPIGSSLTTTGSTIVTFRDTWSNYERINTWDSVPEIEQYVQAFTQSNKAKVQVLHHNDTSMETPDVVSPSRGLGTRVTDFPSEVERPSLPVTPAPRRPGFWEAERDKDGELPAAAGVPQQEDWNPVQRLEELQKHRAEVLQAGTVLPTESVPDREMPHSAVGTANPGATSIEAQTESTRPTLVKDDVRQPSPSTASTLLDTSPSTPPQQIANEASV